jgi:pimeloyl-ACP methyl ester carboxylesterase
VAETTPAPETIDVPVNGGQLRALRWGGGDRTIVAAHGITSSAVAWQAIARLLPDGWSLTAADLRGRGHSADLPGPYGFARHAEDLLALAEHAGGERPVLAGHSMGAYIAVLAAAARPGRFARLVLIDGGLPRPLPEDADPDAVLEATLGPAMARLRQTFPDEDAYLAFWRAHPALAGSWNSDIEDYARYDIAGEPGRLRSRVAEEAVRADGRDLFTDRAHVGDALRRLDLPVLALLAPMGMFGDPPGLVPDEVAGAWRAQVPRLRTEVVPGTNHYTIIFAEHGAKTAAARLTSNPGPAEGR